MIDLEEIRDIVSRSPNIRGKTILHLLEKRKKVEELQAAQYQHVSGKSNLQQALDDGRLKPPTSFFQWLLNGGK